MILLIAFGDMLIGIYLLSIVITDHLYNTDYCPEQLKWLISRECSLLSTIIGSQVSPGLLRALFFGEKCATCVQFMECAGVR